MKEKEELILINTLYKNKIELKHCGFIKEREKVFNIYAQSWTYVSGHLRNMANSACLRTCRKCLFSIC